MSHDLKTPLSLIITPLEKVMGGRLDSSARAELEVVWRNAKLLLDGVTQLLDFRKLDVGTEELHLSHGDMVQLVMGIAKDIRFFADSHNVRLNTRMDAASIDMDFDHGKMRRVVMNLLSNAIKYNRPNGTVDIRLGTTQRNGAPWLRLEVADSGIGIKPENRERIFSRFFQEENSTELVGSGIGLHIVKEYVAMHGGSVWVEENHPEGCVFVVNIPTAIVATGGDGKDSPVDAALRERVDKTLLVVEDNGDMRDFLRRSLSDSYRVVTATDGEEALQVLRRDAMDMVVSDVMMPRMDGMELCYRMKRDLCLSHIPIVLLTAKSADENVVKGLRDGADDYIAKPFNLEVLRLRIGRILDWTRNNHRSFGRKMDIKPSDITVSSMDERLMERATREVEEHMDDAAYTVEDLSLALGMTRGHLYKKLMAITGRSPLEFIRILRIKRGRALLEQGGGSIAEVAWGVGFSPKQFARYFKEEYGVLPSEWVRRRDGGD